MERNRVKRLLREAFARVEPQLRSGQDIVVVARPDARELAEREGLAGVDAALTELIDRARLREDTAEATGDEQASNEQPTAVRETATGVENDEAEATNDGVEPPAEDEISPNGAEATGAPS